MYATAIFTVGIIIAASINPEVVNPIIDSSSMLSAGILFMITDSILILKKLGE